MRKFLLSFLTLSVFSFSTSQAQDILIDSNRNSEDMNLQDISLKSKSILLQEGADNIIIANDKDILFIQDKESDKQPKKISGNYSLAVQMADINSVEFLLSNGTSPNQEIYDGNTIVSIAGIKSNNELLNQALKYKANIFKVNKFGNNFLHLATAYGNLDFFKKAKDSVGEEMWSKLILSENKLGRNLLHSLIANQNNDIELINFFINSGIDVNKLDNNKQSPLQYAVVLKKWDIVQLMLKNGGNLSLQDSKDYSVEDYLMDRFPILKVNIFFNYLNSENKNKVLELLNNNT